MNQNECWEYIKNIFIHMDGGNMEKKDFESSFILVGKMIESYPLILAEIPGLNESVEISRRTRAFSAFLVCKTLQCQADPKYQNWSEHLFSLQKILLRTLYKNDCKRWFSYIKEILQLTLTLCLQYRKTLDDNDKRSGCEASISQDPEPPDILSIFTRKELEKIGRQKNSKSQKMFDDVLPDDSLFPNSGRVVNFPNSDGTKRLLTSLNRLWLEIQGDVTLVGRKLCPTIQKLGLLLAGLPDPEIQGQALELLAAGFDPRETNIRLTLVETELLFSYVNCCLTEAAEEQMEPALRDQKSKILFQFFTQRNVGGVSPTLLEIFRSKFRDMLMGRLDKQLVNRLEPKVKKALLKFINLLIGRDYELGEEERRSLVQLAFHLDNIDILVDISWNEVSELLRNPFRSGKRKREAEEELTNISILDTYCWSTVMDVYCNLSENRDPEDGLKLTRILLQAGQRLFAECVIKHPSVHLQVLSEDSLSKITLILLQYLEKGANLEQKSTNKPLFLAFFDVIADLVVLLHAVSDPTEFQQPLLLLAGLLSIPVLTNEVRQSDLKLGKHLPGLLSLASQTCWGEGRSGFLYQSLYYLSLLPKEICPRWRLSIFKTIGAKNPELTVRCVPNLVAVIGTNTAPLATHLISCLNKATSPEFSDEISKNSGHLICGLSRSLQMELQGKDRLSLKAICLKCRGSAKFRGMSVNFEDIQPIFKLVGHRDAGVRKSVLSMIVPLCTHSSLTNSAAMLLLSYTEDKEFENRFIFSKLIKYLIEGECSTLEGRDQVTNSIVNSLVENQPELDKLELWKTYVPTLVSVYHCILPLQSRNKVLDLLLSLFFTPETHHISYIDSLKVLQDALLKEKAHILRWFADRMCGGGGGGKSRDNSPSSSAEGRSLVEPERMLMYLNPLVSPSDTDTFVTSNLHHILPPVFYLSALKGLKKPLSVLAAVRGRRPKALIDDYFPKIYAYIVVNSDKDNLDMCMKYMKRETGIELAVFITSYRLKVIEELLCVMSLNKDKVIRALHACANADQMFKHKCGEDLDLETVKEYLSNNLMAALSCFLTKLINEGTSTENKLMILSSLAELCKFLGPVNLSPVKHSLLACLKNAGNLSRQSAAFNSVAVTLWSAFIRNTALADLEVIISQVLVGLAYLVTIDKERILPLFKYLLVENRSNFKNLTAAMVLLHDIPELQGLTSSNQPKEVRTLLQGILENIDHEAVEVRQQTLSTLKNMLEANMGAVQGMLLRCDQADLIISELIEKLMKGMSSREPDEDLRYMAAECIGKIGAVEPGKLELTDSTASTLDTEEQRSFLLDVNSVVFCVRLIGELVRACQSSRDPFIVDICMFSIQRVLKIYQIGSRSSSFSEQVMNGLSDAAREIIHPLISSNYVHHPKPQPKISIPVYGSSLGKSYRNWLVHFTQHLIEQIYDSKVKEIFSSCLPVLKKDISTAEFILPHIVVSVICSAGEDGISLLLKEVECILPNPDVSQEQVEEEERKVEGNTSNLVTHTLFNILDHLKSWLRAKYTVMIASLGKSDNQLRIEEIQKATREKNYQSVLRFLNLISNESLANLSFNTGSYHRSAFYLDQTFTSSAASHQHTEDQLNAFQKLYACLEEPDHVAGVAKVRRQEPSLESQILHNQAIGNFQDALCCFEHQRHLDNINYSGLIQCYLNIDQPAAAANLAAGLVSKDRKLARELAPLQAEAAWQLSQWDDLAAFTKVDVGPTPCWEMSLSKVLLSAYRMDKHQFHNEVERVRKDVLKILSAVSSEESAYRKSYLHICRLGMLREVETITDKLLLTKLGNPDLVLENLAGIMDDLEARLSYSQVSWTNLEPILRLRRGVFNAVFERYKHSDEKIRTKLRCEIGECWLKSARIARKVGQLQEAYSFLLEAEKFDNPKIFLESAKLTWERGKRSEAVLMLRKGWSELFPEVESALEEAGGGGGNAGGEALNRALAELDRRGKGLRELCGNGKLLLARYLEEAASVGQEGIRAQFEHAREIVRNSDEIFYYQAKFFDRKTLKMTADQMINQSEIVNHAALTYLRSVRYGPTFLDECIPRMLSIWLDFAATTQEAIQSKLKNSHQIAVLDNASKQLSKLNKAISVAMNKIPTYYFLTAFPQIVSRICHTNNETYGVLKSLMVQVFLEYPQQSFWHMVCVSKNRDATRTHRCNEVFKEVIKLRPRLEKFLTDAILFSKKIDELCDVKTPDRAQHTSFKEILPSLPALFKSKGFSSVILPIERNMVVTSPTSAADLNTHNPFPAGLVMIQGVQDDIQVMISLVKPKKITLRGSDGKLYSFLAKPKDDLRRDCRLMDFGNLLNRMFRKEPETRKRGLKLRTYMVVPTNETNGLIEWVSNLKGLRHIITNLLKERGVSVIHIQKRHHQRPEDNPEKKKEIFRKCIEELKGKDSFSSSVFREWFVRTFPDPQAWFAARLAFTRTTAVMSMMGYILGLGDRHLENINVDTTTGQTFHVDMNSLFNVSETYKVPEIVPFRLTHNIVDGFGPLGIEGPYRISCEVALRMMRKQKDLLMSVMRPFIFDPLVDWTVRDKSRKNEGRAEEGNKPGKEALGRVQDRLDGFITEKLRKGNPNQLSVEGQVDHVIREAMSVDNLSKMYWGWTPFL